MVVFEELVLSVRTILGLIMIFPHYIYIANIIMERTVQKIIVDLQIEKILIFEKFLCLDLKISLDRLVSTDFFFCLFG